jgi:hypothetical protein
MATQILLHASIMLPVAQKENAVTDGQNRPRTTAMTSVIAVSPVMELEED